MIEDGFSSLTIRTPAKINLGLRVVKQRPDGYHQLLTTFQTVDLFDRLRVTPRSNDDNLTVSGPVTVDSGDGNIVVRTLEFLRRAGWEIPHLDIELVKKIPIQSGLGGGSSNAAGIIKVVSKLLNEPLPERLDNKDVARKLGADVPFFLSGGTCQAIGIGDELREVDDFVGFSLIAVPAYSVSTEDAYKQVTIGNDCPTKEEFFSEISPNPIGWRELSLRNDFEPFIRKQFDLHARLKNEMKEFSDKVALSGSGSSIYALFENESPMQEAHKRLKDRFDSVGFFKTKFLTRKEQPTPEESTGS